tara:strand:+ start:6378 stop:6677 length:300 start_codon:yes stop_codon:yes gene_type:complete
MDKDTKKSINKLRLENKWDTVLAYYNIIKYYDSKSIFMEAKIKELITNDLYVKLEKDNPKNVDKNKFINDYYTDKNIIQLIKQIGNVINEYNSRLYNES